MGIESLTSTKITNSGDPGTGAYAEFQTGKLSIVGVYIVAGAVYASRIATDQSKANRWMNIPYLISVQNAGAVYSGVCKGHMGYTNGYMLFVGADRNIDIPVLKEGAVVKLNVYLSDVVGNLLDDNFNDETVTGGPFSIKQGTSLFTVKA